MVFIIKDLTHRRTSKQTMTTICNKYVRINNSSHQDLNKYFLLKMWFPNIIFSLFGNLLEPKNLKFHFGHAKTSSEF